jgi:hypothetical protein
MVSIACLDSGYGFIEKNTFIDYAPAAMTDSLEIPSKTAPARLVQRLAQQFSKQEPVVCERIHELQRLGSMDSPDAPLCRKLEKSEVEEHLTESDADFDCGSSTYCASELPPTEDGFDDFFVPSVCSAESDNTDKMTRGAFASDSLALAAHQVDETVLDCITVKKESYVEFAIEYVAQVSTTQSEDTSLASRWQSNFGGQSDALPQISIKNTFIHVPRISLEPPTKSAPPTIWAKRFQIKADLKQTKDMSSDASPFLKPAEDTSLIESISRATTNGQLGEDRESNPDSSEASSREDAPMRGGGSEAHVLGQCIPCAYFWHKGDGCRLGKSCKYCHLCKKGEIKKRKKERKEDIKAKIRHLKDVGEYIPRLSRRQETGPQSFRYSEQDS